MGALGLVVNVIILWNTLYINAALDQLAGEGYSIQADDVTRLSPLVFEHINLLGRYAFSVPDSVVWGSFDPFAIRLTLWRMLPDVRDTGSAKLG